MVMVVALALASLVATSAVVASAAFAPRGDRLLLTVAYCPTEFSGSGAVVEVDATGGSGDWSVVGTFKLPSAIQGCPALESPTFAADPATGALFLWFNDDEVLVHVDLNRPRVLKTVTPSDPLFTGFYNFAVKTPAVTTPNHLLGLSGTVTQSGYCFDGCFQFGAMEASSGRYRSLSNVPFKAILDDSHYYDAADDVYYVQGSYDLRHASQRCAPVSSDECLLQIDATTGDLKDAIWTQNYTVYKWGPTAGPSQAASGPRLVWMNGFDERCDHPYENFLFGTVDPKTAKATPGPCIPKDVTVHTDEWISAFNADGSLFATGSGDAETGVPQLLVFDPTTAAVKLNSKLPGLAEHLHSKNNFLFIWAVTFA